MYSNKLLRVNFHPTLTLTRHNFSFPYPQSRITLYIYILNDLKFLQRHNTLRGTRKKPLRISYLKDFLISVLTINQTYSTYASQYALYTAKTTDYKQLDDAKTQSLITHSFTTEYLWSSIGFWELRIKNVLNAYVTQVR